MLYERVLTSIEEMFSPPEMNISLDGRQRM